MSSVDQTGSSSVGRTEYFLGEVCAGDNQWTVTVGIGGVPVEIKVDTGADVTVIPADALKKLGSECKPTSRTLHGADANQLDVAGVLEATLEAGGKTAQQEMFVVTGAR